MNNILIISGPTSTGKTKIAVELAKKYQGEIVSADSRQIYKGMDIGTGKDMSLFDGIPVWMIDIVTPNESYSVSQYQKEGRNRIEEIWKRNKLPIIVGGTGLYIQSLLETMPTASIPPDGKLRAALELLSLPDLQNIVQKEDPVLWKHLNGSEKNNARRLIRKIELIRSGSMQHAPPKKFPQNVLWIGLTAPPEYLYAHIDRRVDDRVKQGVQQEVYELLNKGYSWELYSMSGFGYHEWQEFEEKKASIGEVIQKWKFHEHAYARRQMTWLRRMKAIHWYDVSISGFEKNIEAEVAVWYTLHTYGLKD